jgi:hypothetical protein
VRRKGKGVVFKKTWYSLKKRTVSVADLILMEIPAHINSVYEDQGSDNIFPYFSETFDALEYFQSNINEDIIKYLHRVLMDAVNAEEVISSYSEKPASTSLEPDPIVEESLSVSKLFDECIKYYTDKFERILLPFKAPKKLYLLNSGCNSPPIRGPNSLKLVS